MTSVCRSTELPFHDVPELIQFYQHFPKKYPYLLTSSGHEQTLNASFKDKQFDILFIEPEESLSLDNQFSLSYSKNTSQFSPQTPFLNAFDELFLAGKVLSSVSLILAMYLFLLLVAGLFFFAYEFAQQVEPGLQLSSDKDLLPVAYAARIKKALIFDHQKQAFFFLSETGIYHDIAYQSLLTDIEQIKNAGADTEFTLGYSSTLVEESENLFLKSVEKVKHYIKEGDVFQVNLSRLWSSHLHKDKTEHSQKVTALSRLLTQANPAPFSGIASFTTTSGQASVISSSPERLIKVNNNQLESRPIAGTRPRSDSVQEDQRLLKELHAHPKEQAEHIMLIDLIRNDLGRVCVAGTVCVDEFMVNESYAHVHHIVSNVIGQLKQDCTPGDVIKALFPGGTITGCPKVRCMEIINELEQQSRGAYTGSMGYVNLDGSMDLNILIRTLLLEQELLEQDNITDMSEMLSFRAGSGLVYDSMAKNELHETRVKAKGLLNSLTGKLDGF